MMPTAPVYRQANTLTITGLDPDERCVIMHVPYAGVALTVAFPDRTPVNVKPREDDGLPWIVVFNWITPTAVCHHGSGRQVELAVRQQDRGPTTQAVRKLSDGGIAAIRFEEQHRFGRPVLVPVGHRILAGASELDSVWGGG